MILPQGELVVKKSKFDAQQIKKNKWLQKRLDALNYYNGLTRDYTEEFFSRATLLKIPIGNVNIAKRVIDRVSLVYMVPPKRRYTEGSLLDTDLDILFNKDLKLQRLERMTNLLDAVLLKACWRNDRIEYDVIYDYEPIFGEDPLNPVAFMYPIAKKSTVLDATEELWAYWDEENHYIFNNNGKKVVMEGNEDMINPYGMMPFVQCFREGKPETEYLDTNASNDLIQTNLAINVAETNKNANIMFQSFGYLYVNGAGIDKDTMEIGQDQINYLGVDGTINIVSPPNAIPALDESIKSSYKMLAQNYHLSTSFVEGTAAESGVALRLRNLELQDDRKSDVMRWRQAEYELFEIEKKIIEYHLNKDVPELEDVDYDEATEVLSNQEQRDKWEWELSKGLIDEADIMMQINPDFTREEAEEYLSERKSVEAPTEGAGLLEALAKPVE